MQWESLIGQYNMASFIALCNPCNADRILRCIALLATLIM